MKDIEKEYLNELVRLDISQDDAGKVTPDVEQQQIKSWYGDAIIGDTAEDTDAHQHQYRQCQQRCDVKGKAFCSL